MTFSVSDAMQEIRVISNRKFNMDQAGFKNFRSWIQKHQDTSLPMLIVLEATGVYHEKLCHFLYDLNFAISVVLPKRAKDFSKTLKVKKVTDKIASNYLASMGLEKKLELWSKPEKIFIELRSLSREADRTQKKITEVKNQLEAHQAQMWPNEEAGKRLNSELLFLKEQKKQIMKEIKALIESNAELRDKASKLATIPGVGIKTIAAAAGETMGFKEMKNRRQLVSYAGLDVINQESGTSVKTKPRISKRGNKHLRKAMHMPAITSIRTSANKEIFIRIVGKTGIKMKAVVAVQRKILILMYTLWKNNTVYDPKYEEKRRGNSTLPLELDQVRS